jgi:predicted hotdog family 3-hydroxylacyl-ACP dehydratase
MRWPTSWLPNAVPDRPRGPHAYPFRLLDPAPDGGVGVLVTANAAQVRGAGALPAFLAVEVMAQAALVALPAPDQATDAPRGGLLAGVEAVRLLVPLRAGDRLVARAAVLARLGPLIKVRAELLRGAEVVADAQLLIALT